jgi:uncharacterized membrane protein
MSFLLRKVGRVSRNSEKNAEEETGYKIRLYYWLFFPNGNIYFFKIGNFMADEKEIPKYDHITTHYTLLFIVGYLMFF